MIKHQRGVALLLVLWVLALRERGRAAWGRLRPTLDAPLSIDDHGVRDQVVPGALMFDGVNFSYPGHQAVALSGLRLNLPAGQTLQGVDYANGQLRVSGLELSADEARALTTSLQAQGYNASRDGVTWLMQPVALAARRP